MSDLDLELLQTWLPEPVAPSPEVRDQALALLERSYEGPPVHTSARPVRRQFMKRLALAAAAVLVVIAGSLVWLQREVDDRVDNIKTVTVPKEALGGGEIARGPVNILLVGSDSRERLDNPAFGSAAETGPQNSDTMILLHLDGTAVHALWIPRDLLVGVAGAKINSTFNQGPQGLIEAITGNLGVRVDHYAEVDFTGFRHVVDELGGVPVYSPGQFRDPYSGLDLFGPGCRTLDGDTALAWVRSRHVEMFQDGTWVDAGPRGDLDRLARQQELMRSLTRRVKGEVSGDPVKAVRLIDALLPALTLDDGFSRSEIFSFVRALIGIDPETAQLSTLPVEDAEDGGSVVMHQPDAETALAPFKGGPVRSADPPADGSATTTTTLPPDC